MLRALLTAGRQGGCEAARGAPHGRGARRRADPISEKDYKYVWLAANSQFKSDSDLQKYEKARKLKVRASRRACPPPVTLRAWRRIPALADAMQALASSRSPFYCRPRRPGLGPPGDPAAASGLPGRENAPLACPCARCGRRSVLTAPGSLPAPGA